MKFAPKGLTDNTPTLAEWLGAAKCMWYVIIEPGVIYFTDAKMRP